MCVCGNCVCDKIRSLMKKNKIVYNKKLQLVLFVSVVLLDQKR